MSVVMGEVFAGPGFRICSRSACRWPAVATLSFEYSEKKVWLEELRPGPDPSSYDLCAVHAERFAAPSRWEFQDRRTTFPHIPDHFSSDPEPADEKVESIHPATSPADEGEEVPRAKRAGRRTS